MGPDVRHSPSLTVDVVFQSAKRSVSPLYSVDMPLARDALERPTAAIREAQSGAGDQILYRAGHQNFVRGRERGNARADVNGNSADILAHHLAFTGVETGADFDSELTDFVTDSASAAHAACRAVEGGENTIARALDLTTTEARKVALDYGVVIVEKTAPAAVAKFSSFLG